MKRWIIGYGSLVWKPGFDFDLSTPARLHGWTRRLWQGSPDHRGTAQTPGRVATILRDAHSAIGVRAYQLDHEALDAIRPKLDVREKAGYSLENVEFELSDGSMASGEVYIAQPGNPSWLGPAAIPSIAAQIRSCSGPSGSNLEYVQRLASALAQQGTPDPHVNALLSFASPFGDATDPAEQAVRRFLGDAVGTRVLVLGDSPMARATRETLTDWGARTQHAGVGPVEPEGPLDLIIDFSAKADPWAEAFDAPVMSGLHGPPESAKNRE